MVRHTLETANTDASGDGNPATRAGDVYIYNYTLLDFEVQTVGCLLLPMFPQMTAEPVLQHLIVHSLRGHVLTDNELSTLNT